MLEIEALSGFSLKKEYENKLFQSKNNGDKLFQSMFQTEHMLENTHFRGLWLAKG